MKSVAISAAMLFALASCGTAWAQTPNAPAATPGRAPEEPHQTPPTTKVSEPAVPDTPAADDPEPVENPQGACEACADCPDEQLLFALVTGGLGWVFGPNDAFETRKPGATARLTAGFLMNGGSLGVGLTASLQQAKSSRFKNWQFVEEHDDFTMAHVGLAVQYLPSMEHWTQLMLGVTPGMVITHTMYAQGTWPLQEGAVIREEHQFREHYRGAAGPGVGMSLSFLLRSKTASASSKLPTENGAYGGPGIFLEVHPIVGFVGDDLWYSVPLSLGVLL